MELDILIRGGMIFDGTGNPWFVADVGIKDAKIAAVGKLQGAPAVREIDAGGMAVSPGFVDAHAHSDYLILADPTNENKLLQGVTLDVAGNCGYSAAPIGDAFFKEWWVPEISERFTVCSLEHGREVLEQHGIELTWRTMGEYLDAVDAKHPSTNYLNFTGQVALRLATYGDYSRRPTDEEFAGMRAHLHESMRGGSFGVSTESGSHKEMDFDVEELIELCKVAAEYGGVYSNHMRNYDMEVIASTEEAISVSERAGIPSIISHIGVGGRKRGVPAEGLLALIDAARERGVQVTADIMPYGYRESLTFTARASDLLPEWATDGGAAAFRDRVGVGEIRERLKEELREGKSSGWYVSPASKPGEAYSSGPLGDPRWEDQLEFVICSDHRFEGRRASELAREWGVDAFEVLFQALEADFDTVKVLHTAWDEEDLRLMVAHPWVAFGGDGAQTQAIRRRPGVPNPTQYGVFPMILGRYVRQKGWLRWEEAIRKMTSLPCVAMGIYDRGVIRPGAWADVTVFDPDRIIDTPDYYEYPAQYCVGIEHVIVNGVHTVADGRQTGLSGGRTLRLSS
jgi:N-acyl-D-aspartate/D-glutamate deacylase